MENDFLPAIFVIMGIAIIAMVVLFVAGDLHEQGRGSESEEFVVDDPSVDKACTLDFYPDNTPTVTYYNGTTTVTLGAGDYTLVNNVLTVKASAMN